ncbi:hypothetical protein H6M51_02025 [Rhizobium sp. AQ_MP]|uniref:hypothetical protein n=1 Tax=Rhizobium sp. AQ_MP TaxID=2761536 RepID=UPI00163A430A|nr:hypothetical protein [Rhizobium sp. AQ_MP]MBC2771620.1 hypothetical protein [Rhizobium sp. AQ_MP]
MWIWLKEYHGVLSAVSSIAMLGVWVLYLQLFYSSYRHQIRPKILITRGGDNSMAARCILTNMSPEIIFVQAVLLKLVFSDGEHIYSLSERDRAGHAPADRRSELVQGPLRSGDFLDLGSFEDLLSASLGEARASNELAAAQSLTIFAVGSYTWHNRIVAAERTFNLARKQPGRPLLIPTTADTRQITSRKERQIVARMVEKQVVLTQWQDTDRESQGGGCCGENKQKEK